MVKLPKSLKIILRSSSSSLGFTLIELLVVIAIIALLAVIGLSIYSGIQARARDARRATEVDSLAKSIEVTKDPTTGLYDYDSFRFATDYPSDKFYPQDPRPPTAYCFKQDLINPSPPLDATSAEWLQGTIECPSGYDLFVNRAGLQNNGNGITDARSWKICAWLEGKKEPFCKGSLSN